MHTEVEVDFRVRVAIPDDILGSAKDDTAVKRHVVEKLLKEAEIKLCEQLNVVDKASKFHQGGVIAAPIKGYAVHANLDDVGSIINFLDQYFDCTDEIFACSLCGDDYEDSLKEVLGHLDDEHELSGEEIADWLLVLDIDIRSPR